jgi:hypothetical protein
MGDVGFDGSLEANTKCDVWFDPFKCYILKGNQKNLISTQYLSRQGDLLKIKSGNRDS